MRLGRGANWPRDSGGAYDPDLPWPNIAGDRTSARVSGLTEYGGQRIKVFASFFKKKRFLPISHDAIAANRRG
jgi:hypothetical protein